MQRCSFIKRRRLYCARIALLRRYTVTCNSWIATPVGMSRSCPLCESAACEIASEVASGHVPGVSETLRGIADVAEVAPPDGRAGLRRNPFWVVNYASCAIGRARPFVFHLGKVYVGGYKSEFSVVTHAWGFSSCRCLAANCCCSSSPLSRTSLERSPPERPRRSRASRTRWSQ